MVFLMVSCATLERCGVRTCTVQLTTCAISLAATKSWRGAEQAAAANGPTEATTMKKNPNPPRSQAPGPWSKHLHA